MIAEVSKIREADWDWDDELFAQVTTEGVRDSAFRDSLRKSAWGIKIIRGLRRAHIFHHVQQAPTAKGRLPLAHVPRVVSRFREFMRLHYPQEQSIIDAMERFDQQAPESAFRSFVLEFWIDPLPLNVPALCRLNAPTIKWVVESVLGGSIDSGSYTRTFQRWGLARVPQSLMAKTSVPVRNAKEKILYLPRGQVVTRSDFQGCFRV